MNSPIPTPIGGNITTTTALLNVGLGSNPAAYVPNPGPIAAPNPQSQKQHGGESEKDIIWEIY